MSVRDSATALVNAILEVSPQSAQRRQLLERLVESVIVLVEQDADTLDLKIAESALSELVEAFGVYAPWRHRSKVTIFGSARTPATSPIYKLTEDFAAEIVRRGWMVVTGAGPGIMEAGMRGAGPANSFGVNIRLPFEQGANEVIAGDEKLVEMRYFFTRKVMLTKESRAFVAMPGGFGTLDEVFELLTLLQTGKAVPAPVVLLDTPTGSFWTKWTEFVEVVVARDGYVNADDDNFYVRLDNPTSAADYIERFYRIYDSFRMVGDTAVMRLRRKPTSLELDELNEKFSSIVTSGLFQSSGPLSIEVRTNDCLDLHRIVWKFDRRGFDVLRRMITHINEWP